MKSNFFMFLFLGLILSHLVQAAPRVSVDESQGYEAPKSQKFYLSGYGEFHYNNVKNSDDTLEMHRFVVGFNYDFTDRIHFRSEVEFEHGFRERYIEYAYLDFELARWVNIRVGSILVPIGYINERHEPTDFYSVERPDIYSRIIPTTWMEGGVGVYGEIFDGLHYKLYGHTSLNYNEGYDGDAGFSGSSGLRGGRGKVSDIEMDDFAGSARLEYTGWQHARFGVSGFVGNTSHNDTRVSGGLVGLIEADAKFFFEGFELEGLVAVIFNPDAGEMTTAQRADGNISATDVIGQRMLGFMVEGAYHVFHHLWEEAPVDLVAFVRYEKFDTHHKVPTGFSKNPAYDRQNVTFGLSFFPVDQVVLKADYSWKDNDAGTANNQFNLGAGFYF